MIAISNEKQLSSYSYLLIPSVKYRPLTHTPKWFVTYVHYKPHRIFLVENLHRQILSFDLSFLDILMKEEYPVHQNDKIFTNTKQTYRKVLYMQTFSYFVSLRILREYKYHESTNILIAAHFRKYKHRKLGMF